MLYTNLGSFIGNMSNPVINRLGKNQIWYKHYYADFSYKLMYKLVYNFESLINNYFIYGLYNYHKLYNIFWYKNFFKNRVNNINNTVVNPLYFRKYYYSHKTLTIDHSYFIRLRTDEFFPLRLYILKYNNWIITSVQWFKPLKNRNHNNKASRLRSSLVFSQDKTRINKTKNIRVRFYIYLIKSYVKGTLNHLLYTF